MFYELIDEEVVINTNLIWSIEKKTWWCSMIINNIFTTISERDYILLRDYLLTNQ